MLVQLTPRSNKKLELIDTRSLTQV